MKKLTKELVNKRIIDRGIQQIGEYINSRTKTEFQCDFGHIWKVKPNDILNGSGCPKCAGLERLSIDIINQRLEENNRDIRQIGDYNGALVKTEFQCESGHTWSATPNSIISGKGCRKCANIRMSESPRLSTSIINERLEENGRNIRQIGDYNGALIKTDFQCGCGNIWSVKPNDIMSGRGCPKCSIHGYNPGKPGWLYILIFNGYIKYGITNNINNRLNDHKKNGEYTVAISKLYEDGDIAKNWERDIKIIFGGRFVSKEIMPDGYTETLCVSKLDDLLKTIR
jgi:hypothetical protein